MHVDLSFQYLFIFMRLHANFVTGILDTLFQASCEIYNSK